MSLKSIMKLTEYAKSLYIKTAKKLKGTDRRQFMAFYVKGLGIGGQTLAERELGWNRRTIRKGMQELKSGQPIIDGFHRSGRQRVETKLPNFLKDIKSLVSCSAFKLDVKKQLNSCGVGVPPASTMQFKCATA